MSPLSALARRLDLASWCGLTVYLAGWGTCAAGLAELANHDSLTGIGPLFGWRLVIGGGALGAIGWLILRHQGGEQ